MDINGTTFHLLTGECDWDPFPKNNLWWDQERSFLSLTPKILRFSQRQDQCLLSPHDRRGAACDRYGNFFWISDDEQGVRFLPAGTDTAGSYWSIEDLTIHCDRPSEDADFYPIEHDEPITIAQLRGLTVTEHQYLVVGTVQPAGLLIFDLHAGGPPTWMLWPAERTSPPQQFLPFDMAPALNRGVWILDRDADGLSSRYWYLDRFFRVITKDTAAGMDILPSGDFEPVEMTSPPQQVCHVPITVSFDHGFTLPVKNAVAIAGLPDGTVLILDSPSDLPYSMVHRFRYDTLLETIELQGARMAEMLDDAMLKAHDLAFVPNSIDEPGWVSGELTLVADNGNQAFIFGLMASEQEFELILRPRYLPLRRFSGKALVSAGDDVYYDLDERWLPLTPQPRQRFEAEGHLEGIVLDGKEPDCVWHRLMIDGCIPDSTDIEIKTRTANDKDLLTNNSWMHRPKQPKPYMRGNGSEIPLHKPFTDRELQHDGIGTWELLLQNTTGRYVELRLTLKGNGRATPWIRAVRVYYPRFSYLRYLPAVYRDQPDSADFLERFLSNTEGFYSTIEGRIAKAEALLDIRTAPPDFLEWLAGWLGSTVDPTWDDYRRRLFIAHAVLLYRWRGTQIGLRAAIRLAIDPCPDESIFNELKDHLVIDPCLDESIFDELKDQREYRLGTVGGRSVRIVEHFLKRKFPGVVLGDPSELEGPSVMPVNDALQSLSTGETADQRYRDFLRRTYDGETEKDALDQINEAWNETFDSFDQIQFFPQRPVHVNQSRDWVRFVRHEVAVGQPWKPELGAYALHLRFQEFLFRLYSSEYGEAEALPELNKRWGKSYESFEEILFSPVLPEVSAVADDWLHFTQSALSFTYTTVTQNDEALYREFLARRYRRPADLNSAYGRIGEQAYDAFTDITLPAEDAMPSDGPPLCDWIQFVSLTLPIQRNAHRFTVLVPTEPEEDQAVRNLRLAQVKAIVDREKPAHTDFDVKPYWALFMVGGARVGLDTILGESSRYVGMVLGRNYLGQSFLEHSHPWNVADRTVVGRDPLMEV